MVNQIVYNIVLCLTCMSHWPPVSDQTEPQCVWMTCLSEPWYLLGGRSVAWVCNRRALTYKTYLNSIPTCHWAHICRTPAHCDTTWHCTGCPPPCQTWVTCHNIEATLITPHLHSRLASSPTSLWLGTSRDTSFRQTPSLGTKYRMMQCNGINVHSIEGQTYFKNTKPALYLIGTIELNVSIGISGVYF